MKKIICIADTHFPLDYESKSLFQRHMDRIGVTKAHKLHKRLTASTAQANMLTYYYLNQHHADLLIHLGDVTNGRQEQGIRGACAFNTVQYHTQAWRQICPRIHFCLGGHDTGYSHRGSLPGSGINTESFQNCQEIFGDLWWMEQCEGVSLFGICSPLANYLGNDGTLEALREQQENFLHEAKDRISGKPWILFAHDPFLPRIVSRLFHHQLLNCQAFIHGHWHNPKFTRMFRALGTVFNNPLLQISHTCPSVAPLWWKGCGMMKVVIDGENVKISNQLLDVPPETACLPTTSFLRCLWWKFR